MATKRNGTNGNGKKVNDKETSVVDVDVNASDENTPVDVTPIPIAPPAVDPAVEAVAKAKAINDAERKSLRDLKNKLAKAKRLMSTWADVKGKKEIQLLRAKAGTAKTPEELAADTAKLAADKAKLLKDNAFQLNELKVMEDKLALMDQEIKELRAAKKKENSSNGKERKTSTSGNIASAKAALAKALGRRLWIVRYGTDGAVQSASKEVDGVTSSITFNADAWSIKVGDADTTIHTYGAGAIQIADAAITPAKDAVAQEAATA